MRNRVISSLCLYSRAVWRGALVGCLALALISGCGGGASDGSVPSSALDDAVIPPTFNYQTIRSVALGVRINDEAGLPRSGVVVTVYSEDGSRVGAGMTGAAGRYQQFLSVPIDDQRLVVTAGVLGIENEVAVDVAPTLELVFE